MKKSTTITMPDNTTTPDPSATKEDIPLCVEGSMEVSTNNANEESAAGGGNKNNESSSSSSSSKCNSYPIRWWSGGNWELLCFLPANPSSRHRRRRRRLFEILFLLMVVVAVLTLGIAFGGLSVAKLSSSSSGSTSSSSSSSNNNNAQQQHDDGNRETAFTSEYNNDNINKEISCKKCINLLQRMQDANNPVRKCQNVKLNREGLFPNLNCNNAQLSNPKASCIRSGYCPMEEQEQQQQQEPIKKEYETAYRASVVDNSISNEPSATVVTTVKQPPTIVRRCANRIVACPLPGEPAVTIDVSSNNQCGGDHRMEIETSQTLCMIALQSNQNSKSTGTMKPVARSYNSYPWEPYAGDYASLTVNCRGGQQDNNNNGGGSTKSMCTLVLPPLDEEDGQQYTIVALDFDNEDKAPSDNDLAARFLEKTTFGPTRREIDDFITPREYLERQFHLPIISSHRQYFREHVSHTRSRSSAVGNLYTLHPCQTGSRYRNFAFLASDQKNYVKVQTTSNGEKTLSIDDQIRTVVTGSIEVEGHGELADGRYRICKGVVEKVGGVFKVEIKGKCQKTFLSINGMKGNPEVWFTDANPPNNPAVDITNKYIVQGRQRKIGQIRQLVQPLDDANCDNLELTGSGKVFVGLIPDDRQFWIHTTYHNLEENSLDNPLLDGGQAAIDATADATNQRFKALCSNAPKTFLNQDTCTLRSNACSMVPGQDREVPLTIENLAKIHQATGGAEGNETRYVYVVNNLQQHIDQDDPPCTPGSHSRWVKINGRCTSEVQASTASIFANLIQRSDDENPELRDIFFPHLGVSCAEMDEEKFDFSIQVGGQCWRNTHIDNWQVRDFTQWSSTHRGNTARRNPIKEFAEVKKTFVLEYPNWHSMNRWYKKKKQFRSLGRLGDNTTLRNLPRGLYIEEVAKVFNGSTTVSSSGDVVVCGSPYEVANRHDMEAASIASGFDIANQYNRSSEKRNMISQRQQIWTEIALKSEDQLRQRVAWALSQILAVSPTAIDKKLNTESFVTFYDIFVRHAFGNYFDILRETTYSPLMGQMLTYLEGQSTGYIYTTENRLEYADENFAREIMQLFTIGLDELNIDGTPKLDAGGKRILTYSNDHITEYAKVYTGFELQRLRGNIEDYSKDNTNQVDPMKINANYRDHLPKLGLNNQYVGDGYPLCRDLANKHFMKKGATYRLLGVDARSETLGDPESWYGADPRRISLDQESRLARRICNKKNDSCDYSSTVVLEEDFSCSGIECDLTDLRTVEVERGVWYEYVRPACVHQAFYEDATAMRLPAKSAFMCGDPSVDVASTICCDKLGKDGVQSREGVEYYAGERVKFGVAEKRCADLNKQICPSPKKFTREECFDSSLGGCDRSLFYWTRTSCNLIVKIDLEGSIALIDEPMVPGVESEDTFKMVRNNTNMFFRAEWLSSESSVGAFLSNYASSCTSAPDCRVGSDGLCQCNTKVVERAAFTDLELNLASTEDVLSRAKIGAFQPIDDKGEDVKPGLRKYPSGSVNLQTIFKVTDHNGIAHYRRNIVSQVTAGGLIFRNPVSFFPISQPTLRDLEYETDAALEHYFYHNNTAPFLAIRLAQRFGISNPSPRYVETISRAFRKGIYSSIGSGKYGCMQATMAAVLLDRESLDPLLDIDPTHGSLHEPFLKIMRVMRSLEFQATKQSPLVRFKRNLQHFIGQEPYKLPSVFSFFKPEYRPSGHIASAGLSAPEAQVINGPSAVNSMNTILSYLKYGLSSCFQGFGLGNDNDEACSIGNNKKHKGISTYSVGRWDSVEDIVDELATMLTSGRLSGSRRRQVRDAYESTINGGKGDLEALINAQQLIALSPEFNTNGKVRKAMALRSQNDSLGPTANPYKAVVYAMLPGGVDSYNMLVPEDCTKINKQGKTVREQYDKVRGSLAFDDSERVLKIDAGKNTSQPCTAFVIHDELTVVKELYDQGELVFFANAGMINEEGMSKRNYQEKSTIQLFAHNSMQEATKQVDPFFTKPTTGVLGRAKGVLTRKGYNVDTLSVDKASVALETDTDSARPTSVVGRSGVNVFADRPISEEYFDIEFHANELNAEVDQYSSIYGDLWSQQFVEGINKGRALNKDLEMATLDSDVWYKTNGRMPAYDNDPEMEHWQKWSTLFKLMQTHKNRNTDRDLLYAEFGSWDHHREMKTRLREELKAFNHGLSLIVAQLKREGLWDSVTIVVASEFARTLKANNNDGSDHGWGGNYFMMGGKVKGGQILGEYPSDLTNDVGRGRILPTTPWDAIWNGVVKWLGATEDDELNDILPNRKLFSKLFTEQDLFKT